LGPRRPLVDPVDFATADAHDPSGLDRDVEAAPVCAEDAGRLNPLLDVVRVDAVGEVLVDAAGPAARTRMRSSPPPRIRDALFHDRSKYPPAENENRPTARV
jgi:hypothetical protein